MERKTDRRYNFYTSLTKRPGRLGDYRVLTNAVGPSRPSAPTHPWPVLQILLTLTLFLTKIRLMSCEYDEGLVWVLGAWWTRPLDDPRSIGVDLFTYNDLTATSSKFISMPPKKRASQGSTGAEPASKAQRQDDNGEGPSTRSEPEQANGSPSDGGNQAEAVR